MKPSKVEDHLKRYPDERSKDLKYFQILKEKLQKRPTLDRMFALTSQRDDNDKFWGRIHLAISLVGRNSPLSLENRVVLYKQVLRPIITYASPVWGAAAATLMKKIQVIQNKILRLMTNAPWYVRNDVIHYDLHMESISSFITKLARNVFRSIENHDNPIIRAQTLFTYPHPKLKFAYATAKWQIPLKPP
ncbi:putative RNA-directed DNA polymerase from transposon X-element [Trichonephila clavipes]|nr:putative RNA-directed DNA polymerase from transposon X-element [Trichonephila clavipes]